MTFDSYMKKGYRIDAKEVKKVIAMDPETGEIIFAFEVTDDKDDENNINNCTKYVNPYGTVFIDCSEKNNNLTLSPYECYQEDLLYCPFCGKKMKSIVKELV